jgi:HEAT repeat protein
MSANPGHPEAISPLKDRARKKNEVTRLTRRARIVAPGRIEIEGADRPAGRGGRAPPG